MLGRFQDAGNTTTPAHYLRLLDRAFLVSGLDRFSPAVARTRGSNPKLILWNNALATAKGRRPRDGLQEDHSAWGRILENAALL